MIRQAIFEALMFLLIMGTIVLLSYTITTIILISDELKKKKRR